MKSSVFQALAIFWYLDNRNDKWKTSGIKDEDIFEVAVSPRGGGHDETIRWAAAAVNFNTIVLGDSIHFYVLYKMSVSIRIPMMTCSTYNHKPSPVY